MFHVAEGLAHLPKPSLQAKAILYLLEMIWEYVSDIVIEAIFIYYSKVLYKDANNEMMFDVQQQINYSLSNIMNHLYFILLRGDL